MEKFWSVVVPGKDSLDCHIVIGDTLVKYFSTLCREHCTIGATDVSEGSVDGQSDRKGTGGQCIRPYANLNIPLKIF